MCVARVHGKEKRYKKKKKEKNHREQSRTKHAKPTQRTPQKKSSRKLTLTRPFFPWVRNTRTWVLYQGIRYVIKQ